MSIISVKVALRIRPLVENETLKGCRKCLVTIPSENQVQLLGTDKAFTYTHIFDENISQEDFYEQAVKPLVTNIFKGYNITVLAYGQTGSGKTYSMGTNYDGTGDMGVIPRALENIFQYIQENSNDFEFRVTASFLELYQENLYDILMKRPREDCIIDIREDTKGIKIPGLTETLVSSCEETLKCLIDGSSRRATGATAMNAQSSRSHAIFTVNIYMAKKSDMDNATTAKFHFVDLAGSERSKKTKASGERFKEGVNINKGLLALGNVISALGDGNQSHIPYRDSKLTRLLQDSLGGNSMTMMIACVSPADYNFDETISTLRYADRALKIKNKPVVNQDPKAAEITRLNQLVQQLRLQLISNGGEHMPTEEVFKIKEENIKLHNRTRELNSLLSSALAENTVMFERQLLTQSANERLKKKLLELQETYNVTLSNLTVTYDQNEYPENIKNQIEKLQEMKYLITDLQTEHKKNEEEILKHEYQSNIPKTPTSTDHNISEPDLDKRQESHTKEQLCLNMELQELNRQLALKEQLASQIIANNNHMVDYVAMSENESKISILEKEKDELLQQLRSARSSEACSKLAEQRRKRVKELENQISDLNRKVVEQARLIKMKEKDDLKIKQLNNEIQSMKMNKVKLIKTMRTEEQKFRAWKQQKEKDLMRLKDQDRKRQNQMVKMEYMHNKQQTVLKRKVEEAVAINKRLKDALALQKTVQERRGQNSGKTDRIQQWVTNEFDVMVGTIDAQCWLDQLLEDRAILSEQLENYRNNTNVTNLPETEEAVKTLTADIELRSAQIADLQQKIIDSDQENKSKTRWDTIQSMVDAKCALKYLFDLTTEMRKKSADGERKYANMEYKMDDLNQAYQTTLEKLAETEKRIKENNLRNEQHLSQTAKDYEEKICVLLNQLRGINIVTNDQSLQERLRIQEEALEKLDFLQQELESAKEENEMLKEKLEQIKDCTKTNITLAKKTKAPDTTFIKNVDYVIDDLESSYEENDNDFLKDPDWQKTPIGRKIIGMKPKVEHGDRQTIKRSSDGSTKCTCKGSCANRMCGCRKLGLACNSSCKCKNCCNKEDSLGEPSKKLFMDLNDTEEDTDSFKKPNIPSCFKLSGVKLNLRI